jgi:rubrerythrin
MSTNLHINAHRKITIQSTGKEDVQHISRVLWQTPSSVSRVIRESTRDTLEMYKEYVMSVSQERTELVYHEDDWMREGEPVGTQKYHAGKDECTEVDLWVAQAKEQGYEIEFYVW